MTPGEHVWMNDDDDNNNNNNNNSNNNKHNNHHHNYNNNNCKHKYYLWSIFHSSLLYIKQKGGCLEQAQ